MQQTLSRIQRRNTSRNEVYATYHRLNQFIEKINQKIVNRIQLVQQVYIQDYKTQVKQMTEELKTIRAVLDEQLLRQRANERLFFLEEERDFFRGQVMKLNADLNASNKTNQKLKQSLEEAQAEAKNYKNLVYSLQKKIHRIQGQAFELEKLKKITKNSSMPFIQSKSNVVVSPQKTVSTKMTVDPLTTRVIHRSVELKKDINGQQVNGQLRRKEEILEQCIKDIKKKIFYRSLSQGMNQKVHFNADQKVTFDKFTRTDRQNLVHSILSNPQILENFYKFMTNGKETIMSTSPSKFQSSQRKMSFNDKIFKIKLCGLNEDKL